MGVAHLAQYDLSSEFKRLGYADLNKSFLSIPEIKRILQHISIYTRYPSVVSSYRVTIETIAIFVAITTERSTL